MGDQVHIKPLVVDYLINGNRVRMTESGDVVFIDGDDEIESSKGMENLKKTHPDWFKNSTKAGGGSSAGTKDKNMKTMTLDDFNNLSGKDRVKIMSEGYKLT